MKINIYNSAAETARALIERLLSLMEENASRMYHFAFSGGATPSLMFDLWAREYADVTAWERMCIYWVDERCVPPDDPESNYGNMCRLLLDKIPISSRNLFPIDGCNSPEAEAMRYSKLIGSHVPLRRGFPSFDVVLLGAGDDGHTSSIFPGQVHLLSSMNAYEVSVNPYNNQRRIAMTGCPMFHAQKVVFLITGRNKAGVVKDMLGGNDTAPAAYIAHHVGDVELFLDDLAAR